MVQKRLFLSLFLIFDAEISLFLLVTLALTSDRLTSRKMASLADLAAAAIELPECVRLIPEEVQEPP